MFAPTDPGLTWALEHPVGPSFSGQAGTRSLPIGSGWSHGEAMASACASIAAATLSDAGDVIDVPS